MGTGHLHDITVVTPVFFKKRLVSFFACTAHIVDIGGRGFGADAQSIHEEGLYIPIMKLTNKGRINNSLISIVKANVREPDQVVGDIYALATCNEVGKRRLLDMMSEFNLSDLNRVSKFIFDTSRKATKERISSLPKKSAMGSLTIDGYSKPITIKVKLTIHKTNIVCDFSGTSEVDANGINVPIVYTKAYTCYALKCAIAPEIPNNTASLEPFKIIAQKNSIVNAIYPSPVALRHIIGHFIPDTVYNALDKILPNLVPAEGAATLCNFQVSLRPVAKFPSAKHQKRAEILTFNSGGSGARPTVDGMNATAFPSGVMTMPIEATEQTGPIIIWRKELRQDSGGPGKFRGGLGQFMEVGAQEGYEYDFQAMFDRVKHPALGRNGAHNGSPTDVRRDDGVQLNGKGKQFIPEGKRVLLSFPGGGGYGHPSDRKKSYVKRDFALGYISKKVARTVYGLSTKEIKEILVALSKGKFDD
jgi:N-methylhydantoinase B